MEKIQEFYPQIMVCLIFKVLLCLYLYISIVDAAVGVFNVNFFS